MGWRLVRTHDYDALREELRVERVRTWSMNGTIRELEQKIGELKADARAAQAMRDGIAIRVNQLEAESAQTRSKEKGIVAVAPQILSGQPTLPSGGVVSFEDVGDERAEVLRKAGLLDAGDDGPGPGAAESLGVFIPN